MGAKAGFRLELPPRLKSRAQFRQEVYRGKNRLLKDDPVWVVGHPGFQIARKVQCGEKFCFEVCVVNAQQATEFFLVSDKSLMMMLHVVEGAVLLTVSEGNEMQIAEKQSLTGPVPSGRYRMKFGKGSHACFYGYLKLDRFEKRSVVDPPVRFQQSNTAKTFTTKTLDVFSSGMFRKRVLQFMYEGKGAKGRSGAFGFSLDTQLWELLQFALRESERVTQKEKTGARQVVQQIKDCLDELADSRQMLLTVAELAHRFYMHPQNLSRVFKSEFGITLRDYIIDLKMAVGYTLLKDEKLPVYVVALELGYKDPYSFGRQFRAHFGFSPGKLTGHEGGEDAKM